LGKFTESIEEERAVEQLLNLLKVRIIGEHMVDLDELRRLMQPNSQLGSEVNMTQDTHEMSNSQLL